MRHRVHVAVIAFVMAASALAGALPAPAAGAGYKVAIIVGPTGAQTSSYRSYADAVAVKAAAAGATVVKVYSPNATWANVRAAVNGAKIIVYMGHGNGFPNPYNTAEPTDRDNGWGLNRTTSGGDGDSWSSTMVYCGEQALLGTLTSASSAQWNYCGGKNNTDGITPAPGFVMIYAHACYTPGAGEGWDAKATESIARQRVNNYSYPVLKLGAGAYFATDYGDEEDLVDRLLRNPGLSFGQAFRDGTGYSASALKQFAHPDLAGRSVWIQRTTKGSNTDYWYAFAGNPATSLSGVLGPTVTKTYPSPGASNASTGVIVTATFSQAVSGVSGATFSLRKADGSSVAGSVTYNAYWKRAELRPAAALDGGTTYTAVLGTGIQNGAGSPLSPSSWSFSTAGPPPPPPGATVYDPAVRVVFRQGTHTGYRFDAQGMPTATRTSTLGTDSGASTSMKATIANQSGSWFYIANGGWAGYWLREAPGVLLESEAVATSAGPSEASFDPALRFTVLRGTHTGYRFSADGLPTAARTITLGADSGANTSERRALTNQHGTWLYVTNGGWAGYWLPESDVIFLP